MAQEQLFLIEILVDKIRFSTAYDELPDQNDINVTATFGKFATLEILSGDLAKTFKSVVDPVLRDISLEAGKSYLFSSKPDLLLKGLKEVPLKLKIVKQSDSSLIGQVSIPWETEFVDMINKYMLNSEDNAPAMTEGTFDMENSALEESSGTITLFIRLSCFGKSIQTQFQVVQRKGLEGELISKKYLFKSSNATTMFQAQKVVEGDPTSEVLPLFPIAPIYNPSDPATWTGPLKAEHMTAEKLNQYLCKNPDCPGAKQFKEFGIGPAATGQGLGTVYGPTEIPICYGLSHTYGTLDHYGPYGVYTRPKCLEEPFVGSPVEDCSNTPGCECCQNCHIQEDGKEAEAGCQCDPLRLSGGAPIEDDEYNPCRPMSMCKDLMQSFDKVLSAYKKALGPCAQVACPVPHNAPPDACKIHCIPGGSEEPPEDTSNHVSACGTPGCPYSRPSTGRADNTFDQSQSKNACGKPTCPYTKRKMGSATDEEVMEIEALQRNANAQRRSKCPMEFMPPLPPLEPIHWDCPDPLPKGPCRNPQCPLKPPECRYVLPQRGPCGNIRCPYAAPVNCGDQCPFSPPRPCPYPPPGCPPPGCPPPPCFSPPGCPPQHGCPPSPNCPPPHGCPPPPNCPPPHGCPPPPNCPPPHGCPPPPNCPPPSPSCGGPRCPFSPPPCPPPSPSCGSPRCPFSPPPCPSPPPSCGSPGCPFSPPPCPPPPPCPFAPTSCPLPVCPFAPPPCPPPSCGNPTCPFSPPSCPLPPKVPCGNPQCPFAPPPECRPKPRKVVCNNPKCPSSSDQQSACYVPPCEPSDVCANPECPFVPKTPSPCYLPPTSQDMCENPQCPFAPKPPNNSGDICTDPNCPLQLRIPPSCCAPVGPPMACPFDDCPFNQDSQQSPDICENPQCPYAAAEEEICENPECPFATKPMPQEDSICSIPNCPYAKREREKRQATMGPRESRRGSMGQGDIEVTIGDRDPDSDFSPCVPTTCKAEGGTIPCDECVGPGDGESPKKGKSISKSAPSLGGEASKGVGRASASEKVLKSKGKKKNNKKSPKLSYKVGDLYPGVYIGHKECIIPGRNVPAKMGWLWNVHVPCVGLKPRMGWCPGAVQRTVARRIVAYRKKKGLKLREPLSCKASKKSFKMRDNYHSDSDETVAPKPTLSIKKKDGTFFITMNPLKDPYSIDDNENPYMDCTPMQFKITKNKEVPKQSASQMCFCENEEEDVSSSSDSELDIEFTPPAGIIRPDRLKKKKNVVHIDTQYDKADFTPKKEKGGKGGKGKGGKGGKGKKGKK